jgi:large conductance mechanosensitive channel
MQGFMKFVREQGVVGLAVGLAIGSAAGEAVTALVENFINPIVGFILGGADLSGLSLDLVKPAEEGGRALSLGYGAVISSIITLLAVAFVIYYIVKKTGLDKMDVEVPE